jgi:hydroxymethylbilane synthase
MTRPLKLGIAPDEVSRAQAAWVLAAAQRAAAEVGAAPTAVQLLEVPAAAVPGTGLFLDVEALAAAPLEGLRRALGAGAVDVLLLHLGDVVAGSVGLQQLAAVLPRQPAGEALLGARRLAELPAGARVAVGSTRAGVLLQAERPDLTAVHLRGGPRTCLEKLRAGHVDALVLPEAVVGWLDETAAVRESLPLERFLPAPGQGVLGLEVRPEDTEARAWAQRLESPRTRLELAVELACTEHLGGAAVRGVHARSHPGELHVRAFTSSWEGQDLRRAERVVAAHVGLAEAPALAAEVAQLLSGPPA